MEYIYTKDWYKEMQVYGFLVFPETQADWDNENAWYQSEGRVYIEECKRNLEYYKPDLLKFLPDNFHAYIHNATLVREFPSKELRNIVEQWRTEWKERNKLKMDQYRTYLERNKERLPSSIALLCESTLHDAKVLSWDQSGEDEFAMVLDCRGAFHYYADVKLTFSGVKSSNISEVRIGSYWLYEEVYLNQRGFELHVLFEYPLGEMTIVAEDIHIEVLNNK